MLRLRFGVNDLACTIFAAPFLLCEVAGSIEAVQRPASGFRQRCRTSNTRLPQQARSLLGLVPAHAGVPEFLAPERTGPLDELLDVVQATPASRLANDLIEVNAGVPHTPWTRDLAGGKAQAVRDLGDALRCWHDHVLAPHWPSLHLAVATELSQRSWQLGTRGAEETLNTLHPTIRWRDGILEVDCPVTADVDLAGRGLRLFPSAVWTRPVFALGWEQPSLSYPVTADPDGFHAHGHEDSERLGGLIGSTRARVLRRLEMGDLTTSGLAAGLGISLASASTHATVLRASGLVTTRRQGREVRHGLTDLGHRLASGAPRA
ncbi:MAG: winged helix-turn-helix domain-containing protein [Actinomycetota bacterium]|nr:winged helix-turn-helix domain-containing protein [Actinomycetota bacterium]